MSVMTSQLPRVRLRDEPTCGVGGDLLTTASGQTTREPTCSVGDDLLTAASGQAALKHGARAGDVMQAQR